MKQALLIAAAVIFSAAGRPYDGHEQAVGDAKKLLAIMDSKETGA